MALSLSNPVYPDGEAARIPFLRAMFKVLLIEDSLLLQELMEGILGEVDGIDYRGCVDSEADALLHMEQFPVELVIIDIELRQGSGIGVLAALQAEPERYGSPLKVVLTNYAHASMQQRCIRLGCDAFYDKSLNTADLVEYIEQAAAARLRF